MNKFINLKLEKLLYYFLGMLICLFMSSCGTDSNIIQADTVPTTSIKNTFPFETSSQVAQIFLVSLYSRFCVIDCPSLLVVSLYLKDSLGQEFALGELYTGNFNCIKVKPGKYLIYGKNKNIINNVTLHLVAGRAYYVDVKTILSASNQATVNLDLLSSSQGEYYIKKRVTESKQPDQLAYFPSFVLAPKNCMTIKN